MIGSPSAWPRRHPKSRPDRPQEVSSSIQITPIETRQAIPSRPAE